MSLPWSIVLMDQVSVGSFKPFYCVQSIARHLGVARSCEWKMREMDHQRPHNEGAGDKWNNRLACCICPGQTSKK